MTHKEIITELCSGYSARFPRSLFIGYNTIKGSRMYGTLSTVPAMKCIEAPVAENLMMGMAFGMALEGFRPVVCFERHDFILLGLDALVNHVDKMPLLGGYKLPIIVRAIVGACKPLHPGVQHTQDYTTALKTMLKNTPVYEPKTVNEYKEAWNKVYHTPSGAVVIIENRDAYDTVIE